MKFIKKTLLILLGLYALTFPIDYVRHTLQSKIDINRTPYLQMLGQHQVTIRWQTDMPVLSNVKYGILSDQLHDIESSLVTKGKQHSVTLQNLAPDTQYFYQVRENEGLSKIYQFFTAPKSPNDQVTNIWVQGDAGLFNDNARQNYLQAQLYFEKIRQPNRPLIDLWLTTGDNAYKSGKATEFQKHLFSPYKTFLAQTNYWPAFGNHDARRYAYQNQFDVPSSGELGGLPSHNDTYFSFDHGDIHLIYLDSVSTNFFRYHRMENWLEEDLNATNKKWIIVLLHHPPYTKGTHDSDSWYDSFGRLLNAREVFTPIIEKHGVDLVLAGHSHNYERSNLMRCHYGDSNTFRSEMIVQTGNEFVKPSEIKASFQGTVYQNIGSTSKTFVTAKLDHPAMPNAFRDSGSVMIQVKSNTLTSKFITINGEVKDQFSITKNNQTGDNVSCF